MTKSGKVHALLEFQWSQAYEKGHIGLMLKTKYVYFFLSKEGHADPVLWRPTSLYVDPGLGGLCCQGK